MKILRKILFLLIIFCSQLSLNLSFAKDNKINQLLSQYLQASNPTEASSDFDHLADSLREQEASVIRIATAASNGQNALELAKRLEANGFTVKLELFEFDNQEPESAQAQIEVEAAQAPSKNKKFSWYTAPSSEELKLATTFSLYKFILNMGIWISADLSPGRALAISGARTALVFVSMVYVRSIDNFFGKRSGQQVKSQKSVGKESFQRFTIDLLASALVRVASGPVKGASALLSGKGIFEIVANTIATSLSSVFASLRHRRLDREASAYLFLNNMMLITSFADLDLAGFHLAKLASYGGYDLNLSLVLLIGSTAALNLWALSLPQQFKRFANWQKAALNKAWPLKGKKCEKNL